MCIFQCMHYCFFDNVHSFQHNFSGHRGFLKNFPLIYFYPVTYISLHSWQFSSVGALCSLLHILSDISLNINLHMKFPLALHIFNLFLSYSVSIVGDIKGLHLVI